MRAVLIKTISDKKSEVESAVVVKSNGRNPSWCAVFGRCFVKKAWMSLSKTLTAGAFCQ